MALIVLFIRSGPACGSPSDLWLNRFVCFSQRSGCRTARSTKRSSDFKTSEIFIRSSDVRLSRSGTAGTQRAHVAV